MTVTQLGKRERKRCASANGTGTLIQRIGTLEDVQPPGPQRTHARSSNAVSVVDDFELPLRQRRIDIGMSLRRVVRTFSPSPAPTANPQRGVDELIPLVARLERDGQAELVGVGVHGIGHVGVGELLEHVLGAGAPADGLDGDEGGRFVGRLEEVVGFDVRGEVFDDELGVLTAGLVRSVSGVKIFGEGRGMCVR